MTLPAIHPFAIFRHLGHERTTGLAVAVIVLGAAVVSTPLVTSGATGGTDGDAAAPRLAVAGSDDGDGIGSVEEAYADRYAQPAPDDVAEEIAVPDSAGGIEAMSMVVDVTMLSADERAQIAEAAVEAAVEGPFLEDGTLLKPVAVNTTVADGSELVRTYKVRSGDTLVGIASAHDVSMMTLWWANKLSAKDDLKIGQVLKIPPTNGLVVEVKATDTLASLAAAHKVEPEAILEANGIVDPNLVVGQVLVVPGAVGAPIPTPTPRPTVRPSSGGGSGGSSGGSGGGRAVVPPPSYNGGSFAWPTSSRRISQYYHYGHYGIDIDGSTGDPVYAATSGTVIFAGWKNNGGGYQVWIAHGSGLHTTYNHMSSVSVGRGQSVGKGQRVGRVGASGFASGSHLHFEVWRGAIWNGGNRVNPLAYY